MRHARPSNESDKQPAAPAPPKLTAEASVAQAIAICAELEVQPLPTVDTLPATVASLVQQILRDQTELLHLRALLKSRL